MSNGQLFQVLVLFIILWHYFNLLVIRRNVIPLNLKLCLKCIFFIYFYFNQMAMFRKLLEDNLTNGTHVIVNNFRPVQPLGERQVMRSFELNSASNIHLSSLALFLFLVCFIQKSQSNTYILKSTRILDCSVYICITNEHMHKAYNFFPK